MFTRQHYKAIAEIVRETSDVYDHPNLIYFEAIPTKTFADKLADYFAADNPRFDRDQFLIACGI